MKQFLNSLKYIYEKKGEFILFIRNKYLKIIFSLLFLKIMDHQFYSKPNLTVMKIKNCQKSIRPKNSSY